MDQEALTRPTVATLALLLLTSCAFTPQAKLRKTLATTVTGTVYLPPGVTEISSELTLAPGAHDLEILGSGSLLKADENFHGRAVLVADGARNIRLRDFAIDGNRSVLEKPLDMVPPENALRNYYSNNAILFDNVTGAEIIRVNFSNVVSFPILVSRSSGVKIQEVLVEDSGSRNAKRRNNLTGGILIEEGSSGFEVRDSRFRRILGNALWTHSLATSRRLQDGVFAGNRFDTIGRDAIQVGHATRVKVDSNTGENIGFPTEVIDIENGGTPVAIDTAGNVDHTEYTRNTFKEINGKCFDLDGFHDGVIRGNQCINRKRPQDYQFGHFGLVMNNTNPEVRAEHIVVEDNVFEGTKYGAVFVMGRGHLIRNNQFLHINMAQCSDTKEFICVYRNEEPHLLDSGIYLGKGIARMEETRDNLIRGNTLL